MHNPDPNLTLTLTLTLSLSLSLTLSLTLTLTLTLTSSNALGYKTSPDTKPPAPLTRYKACSGYTPPPPGVGVASPWDSGQGRSGGHTH